MRQYAWLDFHGGCWHLITANTAAQDRKWMNRDLALLDLTMEGWIIDEAQDKRPTVKHHANRHSYGYGLRRTIQ